MVRIIKGLEFIFFQLYESNINGLTLSMTKVNMDVAQFSSTAPSNFMLESVAYLLPHNIHSSCPLPPLIVSHNFFTYGQVSRTF